MVGVIQYKALRMLIFSLKTLWESILLLIPLQMSHTISLQTCIGRINVKYANVNNKMRLCSCLPCVLWYANNNLKIRFGCINTAKQMTYY